MEHINNAIQRGQEMLIPSLGPSEHRVAMQHNNITHSVPLGLVRNVAGHSESPTNEIVHTKHKIDFSKLSATVICAGGPGSPDNISALEQYRTLRTKLMDMAIPNGYRTIMVSSSVPGDGKSLTSLNLAFVFSGIAQIRVLLVEADLHRPSLSLLLGLNDEGNAIDSYVERPDAWQSCLVSLADNVDCLLALGQHSLSAEFIESAAMQEILIQARANYDLVIIDSPPMLATADALALVRYCDAALFVVGAGSTPIKAAHRAAELMAGKIIGCVLNRVKVPEGDIYYKSYYNRRG